MCIWWVIISDGGAVFMRSTNHRAQDKGLDFKHAEGPSHE